MNEPGTLTNWRKSSRSSGGGNCVEVAFAPDGMIRVRDSKHPDDAVLTFLPDEWAAFTAGARNDEFQPDDPALY